MTLDSKVANPDLASQETTWRQLLSTVGWYVMLAIECITLYLSLKGNHYAWNLFRFLFAWFPTIVYLLVAITGTYKTNRTATNTLAIFTDILIAAVLATFGHWFYGALILLQMGCEQSFYVSE